jgi:hypothetical protein
MSSNSKNQDSPLTQQLSEWVDQASEYFAHRKGLLPLIGMFLVFLNFLLINLLPADWYIVSTNLLLHLGLLIAIFGMILAWAL